MEAGESTVIDNPAPKSGNVEIAVFASGKAGSI
jgi:hypothetical protein